VHLACRGDQVSFYTTVGGGVLLNEISQLTNLYLKLNLKPWQNLGARLDLGNDEILQIY
jgi:hypothetical protein